MVVLPLPVIACAVWAKRLFHVTDDLLGQRAVRDPDHRPGRGRDRRDPGLGSDGVHLPPHLPENYAEIMARLASAAILVAWFVWMGPSVTVWMLVSVRLPLCLEPGELVIPLGAKGLGLKLRSVTIDRPEVRRALPFIAYITASQLGGLLFDNTDALVISAAGPGDLADRRLRRGHALAAVVRPFVEAFILALSPGPGEPGRARRPEPPARRRDLPHPAAAAAGHDPTVAVACVARPFIHHWVGEQFVARSVPVMWVALASALLWGPGPYSARVLIAVSRLRFSTISGIVAGLETWC